MGYGSNRELRLLAGDGSRFLRNQISTIHNHQSSIDSPLDDPSGGTRACGKKPAGRTALHEGELKTRGPFIGSFGNWIYWLGVFTALRGMIFPIRFCSRAKPQRRRGRTIGRPLGSGMERLSTGMERLSTGMESLSTGMERHFTSRKSNYGSRKSNFTSRKSNYRSWKSNYGWVKRREKE